MALNNKDLVKCCFENPIFQNVISGIILMIVGFLFIKSEPVKSTIKEYYMPDIVQYSHEIQEMAAKEVESGLCPALAEFGKGFLHMRDQTRFFKENSKNLN